MKLNKYGNVLILSNNQDLNVFITAILDDSYRMYVWENIEDIVLINIIEYMDCIIIDDNMLKQCPYNINKMIKSASSCPIVILSDLENESRNKALFKKEMILTKPIDLNLLKYQVRDLIYDYINRQKRFIADEMVIGKYTYCPRKLLVFSEGDIILLSPLENMILSFMCIYNRDTISHKYMYETIWGKPYDDDKTIVSLKVENLINKLHDNIISNEKGDGYRLKIQPMIYK